MDSVLTLGLTKYVVVALPPSLPLRERSIASVPWTPTLMFVGPCALPQVSAAATAQAPWRFFAVCKLYLLRPSFSVSSSSTDDESPLSIAFAREDRKAFCSKINLLPNPPMIYRFPFLPIQLPSILAVQGWDSMARKIYAPVVKSTRLSQISTNLRQFLVVGTCLKMKK